MNIKTSAKILKFFSDRESIQRKKEQFPKKNEKTEHLIQFCFAIQQDVQKHLMKLQNYKNIYCLENISLRKKYQHLIK